MSDTQSQPPQKKKRSGSEQRKRQPRIILRVSPEERAEMEANAAAAGLCLSSYVRSVTTHRQRTRAVRRRPLPAEVLLLQLKGEAGRVDGNLAQFLKLANRGEAVPVDAIADAARAVRDVYIYTLETLRRE